MGAPRAILVALTIVILVSTSASRAIAVPPPLCFTEVSTGLPELGYSSVAWGDYDNDGDLDILISGDGNPNDITRVYRNSGGPNPTFTDILTGLPGASEGEAAWVDFDSDGDLDIIITGWGGGCGRITKIYRNNGGPNPLFTDTLIELPGVTRSALAWGDYDNDGDLDLLLTGHENDFSGARTSRIFRNSGGPSPTFTDIGAGLEGVRHGSVAWGDYDEDGDLDILITGDADGMPVVPMVYLNSGGLNPTFTDAGQGNTEGPHTAAAWGDYDSDGDLDIVLSGSQTSIWTNVQNGGYYFEDRHPNYIGGLDGTVSWGDFDNDGYHDLLIVGYDFIGAGGAKIYRNSGTSPSYLFSIYNAALPGVGENDSRSASVWGDYDGDGDLDILHSGNQNGSDVVRLYRNNCGPANAPPAAPTNLSMTQVGNRATFHWNTSSDDHTPSAGLSYNLRVGTSPGACDVVSPMANATTGYRHIPALGNAMQRTSWEIELPGAGPFYWSVQAVDGAYLGSPFAAEASTAPSAVEEVPVSTTTTLRSSGPNPFSRVTTASFSLAQSGRVSLAVYDVAGRRVRTLADADYPAGVFEQSWDGRDDAGRQLSSGVYFVRMNTASKQESVKVLLAH